MKKLKVISFILACFWLFSPLATCLAATDSVTLTMPEYNKLKQNLQQLDRTLEILTQSSEKSAQELVIAEKRLAKLEQQLLQYESELKQTRELLQQQDSSLGKANLLLTQLSKETKAKVNSLKLQRTGLLVVVGALAIKAFIK